MIKHTKPQALRLAAGLVITLLALSACTTSNSGEQNNPNRYDHEILDQVGGD